MRKVLPQDSLKSVMVGRMRDTHNCVFRSDRIAKSKPLTDEVVNPREQHVA